MVLITHATYKVHSRSNSDFPVFVLGNAGVDLFFIISGFVICLSVNKGNPRVLKFLFNRLIRIMPLYWFFTIIALCIYLYNPLLINSSGGSTSILNSFFLFPGEEKFLVNNGWTLSYEFLFYFVFSAFFVFGKRKETLTVLTLLLMVLAGVFINSDSRLLMFATHPILIEFCMGIFAFYILTKKSRLKLYYSWIILFFGVFLFVFLFFFPLGSNFFGRALNYGLPMFFIFIGTVSMESKIPRVNFLFNLGVSSYSMYLVHAFVLSFVSIVFTKCGLIGFSNIFLISMVLTSLFSGWVCYFYLERFIEVKLKGKVFK